MLWPKKNSYKEFDDEKKFLRLENSPPPPPPHNFSNGRSLKRSSGERRVCKFAYSIVTQYTYHFPRKP